MHACSCRQPGQLCAAADSLISMHVATTVAEHNWSARGRTWTVVRNRLGIERAEKLVSRPTWQTLRRRRTRAATWWCARCGVEVERGGSSEARGVPRKALGLSDPDSM